jgi:hypothetical protein
MASVAGSVDVCEMHRNSFVLVFAFSNFSVEISITLVVDTRGAERVQRLVCLSDMFCLGHPENTACNEHARGFCDGLVMKEMCVCEREAK